MTDQQPAAPTGEAAIRVTVMPTDLNPYGGAFGGWIISQMALAAGSLAARRSQGRAILVAADELRFPSGVQVGEELSVYPALARQGRTSMTVTAEAWKRDRHGEGQALAARGTFTFVAVDDGNRPREIGAAA